MLERLSEHDVTLWWFGIRIRIVGFKIKTGNNSFSRKSKFKSITKL